MSAPSNPKHSGSKATPQTLRSRITTDGIDRTPHRAFMRAMGLDDEAIAKPMIGVVSQKGEVTPCNMTHYDQVEYAKEGVAMAGGTPRVSRTVLLMWVSTSWKVAWPGAIRGLISSSHCGERSASPARIRTILERSSALAGMITCSANTSRFGRCARAISG